MKISTAFSLITRISPRRNYLQNFIFPILALFLLAILTGCSNQNSKITPPANTEEPETTPTANTEENKSDQICIPESYEVFKDFRCEHPRLILHDNALQDLQYTINNDSIASSYYDALVLVGDQILNSPLPEQDSDYANNTLVATRDVLEETYTLSLLYRLTHDEKYLERARLELLAVASFSDWDPKRFLSVAEMTHAVAIGYDWLYPHLSEEDRQIIREAIINKGLLPAKVSYAENAAWTQRTSNWNIVCNMGFSIGALAIAEHDPELSSEILTQATAHLPLAIAAYSPDGAWPEGVMYWDYATRYLIHGIAAFKTALNNDYGFSASPGVSESGIFRLHMTSPTSEAFNFSDAVRVTPDYDKYTGAPALFWLSQRFEKPALAFAERSYVVAFGEGTVADLIWYTPEGNQNDLAQLNPDAMFRTTLPDGSQVGLVSMFRSDWENEQATYLGFKAGHNNLVHGHLDSGSFILDSLGERWIIDLGAEKYTVPGYWGKLRYTYYRTSSEGHNILVLLDDEGKPLNQELDATTPIHTFETKYENEQGAFAIADLSEAYDVFENNPVIRVERGVALLDDRKRVIIRDEYEFSTPVSMRWAIHTKAQITIRGGNQAIL